jgi:hypothetical protein
VIGKLLKQTEDDQLRNDQNNFAPNFIHSSIDRQFKETPRRNYASQPRLHPYLQGEQFQSDFILNKVLNAEK